MTKIHPTAVVDPAAQLDEGVEIGPYCVIGPDVRLGAGTRLMSHVVIDGHTSLGQGCTVHPFASLGGRTQDLKYRGGHPGVAIGDQTVIREYVTVNCATADGDITRVGSRCLLMAYAHVAHDCSVGDEVILANCGTLAGHIVVEDQACLGGLSAVHQFVRLGRLSYVGGCAKVTQDVPPFMLGDGNPLQIPAINSVGLKRHGVSEEAQHQIKHAHRILYREELSTRQALEKIGQEVGTGPEIEHLLAFIRSSERGITR